MKFRPTHVLTALLTAVVLAAPTLAHDIDPYTEIKSLARKMTMGPNEEFRIQKTAAGRWKVIDLIPSDDKVANGTYPTLDEAVSVVSHALGGVTPPTVTATTGAPTATSTVGSPTATATMDPHHGLCGSTWHAPTTHEHGAQPPAWAENAHVANPDIPMVCFDHNHASSPAENVAKHPFMKGYVLQDPQKPCITAYAVAHGSSMKQERNAQFHSIQLWIKDCSGNISYASWLNNFGVPKLYPTGDRVPQNIFDQVHSEQPFRGIMRLETGGQFCEQWYSATGENWSIGDVSLTLCQGVERYNPNDPNEFNYGPGQFNPADLTGGLGLDRQLEVVWPIDRIEAGEWQADQFNRDFECVPGKPVQYAGATYPSQCNVRLIRQTLVNDIASKAPEFGTTRLNLRTVERFNSGGPNVVAPN